MKTRCVPSRQGFLSLLLIFVTLGPAKAEDPAPRRVVSLLPSHTEIIAVLGVLDRVVGVSDAEDPALLPAIPRVGGMDISWEALVKLHPDLILADVSQRRHETLFHRLGLPVVYLPSTPARTVEDVFNLVLETGRLVGRQEAARRWVESARERARQLDARRLPSPGPRVYFEIWPRPLQACGPRSLQGHLLARVGARNIVADTGQAVPLMSAEAVVRGNPEIIFHTGVVSSRDIQERPGWSSVDAIKTMRIVSLNADEFSRAGPRILDAWEQLIEVLSKKILP